MKADSQLIRAIDRRRRDAGWSKAELARRLGVTARCVDGWYAGRFLPGDVTRTKLARLLDLDEAELDRLYAQDRGKLRRRKKEKLVTCYRCGRAVDASLEGNAGIDGEFRCQRCRDRLLISDLGWSHEEALETRIRLRSFEEDWNAPGMEAYDDL